MPDSDIVCIGKTLRTDSTSGMALLLIHGIFRSERDARALGEVFGCDALLCMPNGVPIRLGEVVVMDMQKSLVMGVVRTRQ